MTVVSSGYDRVKNELYETEEWATNALLKRFPVDGLKVWEPAAGNHLMSGAIKRNGANVVTSDIEVYNKEHDFIFDFLDDHLVSNVEADAIITNPPYGRGNRQAVKFAEKALNRCNGMVALLLTAKFDFGKTRRHLFADNTRFIAKINLVDRIQWFEGETTGTEDHAWYVWGAEPLIKNMPVIMYEGK